MRRSFHSERMKHVWDALGDGRSSHGTRATRHARLERPVWLQVSYRVRWFVDDERERVDEPLTVLSTQGSPAGARSGGDRVEYLAASFVDGDPLPSSKALSDVAELLASRVEDDGRG